MNLALALAIFTATVNLGTALALFAISRAPGWRSSRAFGIVALTAVFYSLGNIGCALPETQNTLTLFSSRMNYFTGAVHALSWFPWLLGGPEARWRHVPRPLQWLAGFSLTLAVFFLATGWHLDPTPYDLPIPWARVVYHYMRTTPLGDVYGYFLVSTLLVPYGTVLLRLFRGERSLFPLVLGFTFYVACAMVEVMVANGQLVWLSPADLGFLAVTVPTSAMLLRRFVEDAHRLQELTGQLAGEVQERTRERDRAESALLESERLAALGRLAAGVGHEINNPLTYLQLSLDRVQQHLTASAAPADVRQSMDDARDGAWRIQRVVEGLRTYSRRLDERVPLDVRDIARSALKVAQPRIRHIAMLETQFAEAPYVMGDEPRLVQALVNLLVNSAEALAQAGRGGHIRLATRQTPDGEAVLEVEDNGPGIPPDLVTRVGEPYFTTRASQGGLGLGLFVTRGIVDAHGARLEVESAMPHGARVRIVLPGLPAGAVHVPAEPPPAPANAFPADTAMTGVRRRLLVVDDEPLVLRLLGQLLESEWDVSLAESGDAARQLLLSQSYDVVLCDLMMAGTSGMQLAREVADRDAALRERMVFMTGGAITPEAEEFLLRADVVSIGKPMDFSLLRRLLRERAPRTAS